MTDDFLLQRLLEYARQRPKDIAVSFLVDGENLELSWTYEELVSKVVRVSGLIQARTAHNKGDRVLLLYPPGLDFIAALYGCWHAGLVAVPCAIANFTNNIKSSQRLMDIAFDTDSKILLTHSSKLQAIQTACTDNVKFGSMTCLSTDDSFESDKETPFNLAADSYTATKRDDLAIIQYTSGSTGSPRGVAITHANIIANQEVITTHFVHSKQTIFVSWLPQYHDMGLIGGILNPLYVGCRSVLLDPAHFMARPVRWLRAVSKYKATTSGAPDFAYALCTRVVQPADLTDLDLSHWNLAFSGAEPIRAKTLKSFSEKFASVGFQFKSFYPCYGLAESTLFVTGANRSVAGSAYQSKSETAVSCGISTNDHTVLVVNQDFVECRDGETGEIWVRGPSVAQGYWKQPDATQQTFAGVLANHPTNVPVEKNLPFLRTGDLGYFEAKELFITGRLKDLIIVRGKNFYPTDIEALAVECDDSIATAAAFGIETAEGQRVTLLCELDRKHRHKAIPQGFETKLQTMMVSQLEIFVHDVVVLPPNSLPRTTSGKIRRGTARTAFSKGEFDAISLFKYASPSGPLTGSALLANDAAASPAITRTQQLISLIIQDQSTPQRLISVCGYLQHVLEELLNANPGSLSDSRAFEQQGVDSLLVVELHLKISSDLGINLPENFHMGSATIQTLACLIEKHISTASLFQPTTKTNLLATTQLVRFSERIAMLQSEHLFFSAQTTDPENCFTLLYLDYEKLGLTALESALQLWANCYSSFKTSYIQQADGSWGKYPTSGIVTVHVATSDFRGMTDPETQCAHDLIIDGAAKRFDLSGGVLLHGTRIFQDQGNCFALAVHHLAADAVSLMVALKELERLCLKAPHAPQLLQSCVWDWAQRRQTEYDFERVERDRSYWHANAVDRFKAQNSLPSETYTRGDAELYLSSFLSRKILSVAPTSVELHNLFLTAVAIAFQKVMDTDYLDVGLESHGRSSLESGPQALHSDIPIHTVGWLAIRYPVLFSERFSSDPGLALARVSRKIDEIPNFGQSFGLLAQSKTCPDSLLTSWGRDTQPSVKFFYRSRLDSMNRADALLPLLAVSHRNATRKDQSDKASLEFKVGLIGKNFEIQVAFNLNIYSQEKITEILRTAKHWMQTYLAHRLTGSI